MANKVIYVDPNQTIKTVKGGSNTNNKLQSGVMNPPEDLSISVDLEVTTVSRYSYGKTETYYMSWVSSQNGTTPMVSFFQGKKIGGTNQLTDFYSDISYQTSQTGENIEGVGISSIDIDFDAWYLPQITIKFIDVRGSALFSPMDYNANNPKGNSMAQNFFRCFFTFPYPIFKIQIKGFYGDAVTYDLILIDFKAEFNATSGNFEFITKYIGQTYAFLADIQFDLLVAAPYCNDNGGGLSTSWTTQKYTFSGSTDLGKPIPTLLSIIRTMGQIENKLKDATENSADAKNLTISKVNVDLYNQMITYWKLVFTDLKNYFSAIINSKGNLTGISDFINNTNSFSFKYTNTHLALNNIVATNITFNKSNIEFLYDLYLNNNINIPIISNSITIEKDNNGNFSLSLFNDLTNNNNNNLIKNIFYYNIDISSILSDLENLTNNENEIITISNSNIYSAVENQIIQALNFTPTISNIFEIIFAHLETFTNIFYNTTDSIIGRTFQSAEIPIDSTDVNNASSASNLPPFPQFSDSFGKDAWIGDEAPSIQEVVLVNSLLNALKQTAQNESIASQEIIGAQSIDHISITPLDINSNPYDPQYITSSEELKMQIILRMYQGYFLDIQFLNTICDDLSTAEAQNIYDVLKNNTILQEFLTNYKNFNINTWMDTSNNKNISMPSMIKNNNSFKIFNFIPNKTCPYIYILDKYNNSYLPLNNNNSYNQYKSYFYQDNTNYANISVYNVNNPYLIIPYSNTSTESLDSILSLNIDGNIPSSFVNTSSFVIFDNKSVTISNTASRSDFINVYNYVSKSSVSNLIKMWENPNALSSAYKNFFGDNKLETNIIKSKVSSENPIQLYNGITNINLDYYFNINTILIFYKNYELTNENLLSSNLYKSNNQTVKALLFLHALPFDKSCNSIYGQKHQIINIPKIILLYLGSVLWRFYCPTDPIKIDKQSFDFNNNFKISDRNHSLITNNNTLNPYNNNGINLYNIYGFFNQFGNETICNFPNELSNDLILYFLNWVNSDSTTSGWQYIYNNGNYDEINYINNTSIGTYNLLCETVSVSNLSIYNNFNITSDYIQTYLQSLVKKLNNLVVNSNKNNLAQAQNNTDAKIVKKELYKTLKNLYDKWFASHPKTYYSLSNFYKNSFIFIDKFYNNIGDDLLINIDYFIDILLQASATNTDTNTLNDRSLYSVLTDILVKHNMLLLPTPNYLNIQNTDVLSSVFKPVPWYQKKKMTQTPFFVCMAVGEPSSKLNLNNEYKDDGMMIVDPSGVTNIKAPIGEHLPCFAVDYGVQDQSYFKNMQINMNNAVNTDQAIAAVFRLSNQGSGVPRLAMGNDFYSIYTTNSYQISIDMMGDAQIQQLMYFQLMNVQMFRGCYLIYKMHHGITPGNMITTFTGMRMTNIAPYINKNIFSLDKNGILPIPSGAPMGINKVIPQQQYIDLTKNINLNNDTKTNNRQNKCDFIAHDIVIKDENYILFGKDGYHKSQKLTLTGNFTLGSFTQENLYYNLSDDDYKKMPQKIFVNLCILAQYVDIIKAYVQTVIKGTLIITNTMRWDCSFTGSFHHIGCAIDMQIEVNKGINDTALGNLYNYIYNNDQLTGGKLFRVTQLFLETIGNNNWVLHYASSQESVVSNKKWGCNENGVGGYNNIYPIEKNS
jgi:hypothetical protein